MEALDRGSKECRITEKRNTEERIPLVCGGEEGATRYDGYPRRHPNRTKFIASLIKARHVDATKSS